MDDMDGFIVGTNIPFLQVERDIAGKEQVAPYIVIETR